MDETHWHKSESAKADRDARLDGWRGLSVIAVIVGHIVTFKIGYTTLEPDLLHRAWNLIFRIISPVGIHGVHVFFVMSGYLITSLLLKERERNGQVNLLAFYVRRTLRIMPAFYFFLFTVWLMSISGHVVVPNHAFLRSALYTCNFADFECSWWLAHTWSLAVEEQFYLLWPLIFIVCGKSRIMAPIIFTLLSVLSVSLPHLQGFTFIAAGCSIATYPAIRDIFRKLPHWAVATLAFAVLVSPLIPSRVVWSFHLLEPVIIAALLFATLDGRGPVSPCLDNGFIQKIGLISYSLYLWQQLAVSPAQWGHATTGASGVTIWLVMFPIVAFVTYLMIERPGIKMGHRVSAQIISERTWLGGRTVNHSTSALNAAPKPRKPT